MSTRSDDTATASPRTRALAVQWAAPGAHLCACHTSDEDRRRLVAAFVAGGLAAGDRVLYVAQDRDPGTVARELGAGGAPTGGPLHLGQLAIRGFAEIYGTAPRLQDVGAVLAEYQAEAARSRADGQPGLRVAVEMGDFTGALGSLDDAVRWERTVTPACAEAGIVVLCQYDERTLGREACARIAAEHPAVATDDGTAPLATFTVTATPSGVRVAGDLDRSNAQAFARVLRARAAVSPRVHVDLEALEFADLGALRALFEVAHDGGSESVFVLRRVPDHVRRLLAVIGWSDDRVKVEPP